MNNYEFCAAFAANTAKEHVSGFKVLDYGCGAGEIIKLMCDDGLDACGCETFYEGGNLSSKVPAELKDRIFAMQGDRIPFPDDTFDLVMSNQVLEHVNDLDIVLSEISRVLKPGGVCLSLFPHREVWREGHCNIPFLHRFPKGSTLRIYYAAALRALGVGYFKDEETAMNWSRYRCTWLDKWCFYRPYRQIAASFVTHLSSPKHIEADWIVSRSQKLSLLPRWLRQLTARKFAGLVFFTVKPSLLTVFGDDRTLDKA
jgi:SAM-dependent methyltransferase